jgi:hypothetical protein
MNLCQLYGITEHLRFGIGRICSLNLKATDLLVSAFSVSRLPLCSGYQILRDLQRNVVKAVGLASGEGVLESFLGKVFLNFSFYLQFCLVFYLCVLFPGISYCWVYRGGNLDKGHYTGLNFPRTGRVPVDFFSVLLVRDSFSGLNILCLLQIAGNCVLSPTMENRDVMEFRRTLRRHEEYIL